MGLTVKNFSAGYEKRGAFDAGNAIVRNVSFSLRPGTVTALAGSNGCGKTTLLRGLCGLIPADGTCMLDGLDLRALSARQLARAVSYIPQRSGITVPLPVIDVVLMGFEPVLHLLEQPGKLHREQARAALAAVGMAGYENHSFQTLSEGQKQLCILARTLVQDAPLLLLDEPDSALDFTNRHLLLDTLRRTVADSGRICLLVLHDLSLALDCCDQLLLMESGQITGVVHPRTDSEETLSSSFSSLYGPVRVFRRDGHCFLYKIV